MASTLKINGAPQEVDVDVDGKTEARFFSRTAANRLMSIFDGIGELQTRDGRPLVVDAGPGTDFHTLYHARVFQSDDKLEAALGRPDVHLGSPPAPFAAPGRMNADGISVFYGTNNQKAAIAEVRPTVGSQIAVTQFEIIRKLRLLDLAALSDVRVTGSLCDFGLAGRMETAVFLRLLSERIMRPAMPDDDPFECLATQAIADFLATEASVPIDGIIFPSGQAGGDSLYVVLFHKAARIEALNVPEGTEISASTGYWTEDGWVEDYEVVEKIAPVHREVHKNEQELESLDFTAIAEAMRLDPRKVDWREASLRIVPESMEVHRVKRAQFATDAFTVKRHRQEKRDSIDR
ncbi:RES family NAD+ phosphorylase [Bradyrhizobium sp. Ai1a-2]|uniref:RES family NAD+ phosphorylase n=1 Tax=Bradyrhizobium sp. Ai1a-2 TaxID=196490 RepID=UPI0003FB779E|nr:RES family NAD+ phosphorylase [Bradyrhizobium sp. Ai1a-2]